MGWGQGGWRGKILGWGLCCRWVMTIRPCCGLAAGKRLGDGVEGNWWGEKQWIRCLSDVCCEVREDPRISLRFGKVPDTCSKKFHKTFFMCLQKYKRQELRQAITLFIHVVRHCLSLWATDALLCSYLPGYHIQSSPSGCETGFIIHKL